MELTNMKEKIRICFERLQGLNVPATRDNMERLLQTLYDLQEIYNELEDEQDGRQKADPG
jgi:hypothetical protein